MAVCVCGGGRVAHPAFLEVVEAPCQVAGLGGRRGGRERPLSTASPIIPAAPGAPAVLPRQSKCRFLPALFLFPLLPASLTPSTSRAGGAQVGALLPAAPVARSETFPRSALPRSERRTPSLGVSPPLQSPDAQFSSRARNFPVTLLLPWERGGPSAAGLRARTKPRSLMVHLFYSNACAFPGLGKRGAPTRAR